MAIIALDFDGVLCDSARETAVSAWRAGASLWPEWRDSEPPAEVVERFVQVRPYLETGYQAIPMLRMVVEGRTDAEFRDEFVALCEAFISRYGVSRTELVSRFGAARDAWIAADEAGWLARHAFYPGVLERLSAAVLSRHEVYILTTKQERFVKALLGARGIVMDAARIHGLERQRVKEDILADLLAEAVRRGAEVHFVEDRLETLLRSAADARLQQVQLYYAAWGYGTPEERGKAQADPRMTVWELADFLNL